MKSPRLSLALSLVGLLAACGGGDTGKVSVLLKDGPGDFSAAVVTISEIDLVGSDGGITPLSTTKTTTDLLTLSHDTATLVKDAVVHTGTYAQLRFVITGGYIAVDQADGSTLIYASSPEYEGLPPGANVAGALQMPSYAQSGLKVDLPANSQTVGTDSKVLLVDFIVSQSFGQEAGGSGQWVMHPVVKATDVVFSGTVNVTLALGSGVTLPGGTTLGSFSATLTNATDTTAKTTVTFTVPSTGPAAASFLYLFPGTYSLTITANTSSITAFATDPALPQTVTVTSGQLTTENITLTSVN